MRWSSNACFFFGISKLIITTMNQGPYNNQPSSSAYINIGILQMLSRVYHHVAVSMWNVCSAVANVKTHKDLVKNTRCSLVLSETKWWLYMGKLLFSFKYSILSPRSTAFTDIPRTVTLKMTASFSLCHPSDLGCSSLNSITTARLFATWWLPVTLL